MRLRISEIMQTALLSQSCEKGGKTPPNGRHGAGFGANLLKVQCLKVVYLRAFSRRMPESPRRLACFRQSLSGVRNDDCFKRKDQRRPDAP
jgi:hypothetical protein